MTEKNMFDPDSFIATSALAGKIGVILPGSEAIRHNYGGNMAEETTALRIVVAAPDKFQPSGEGGLEKARVNLYGAGGLYPARMAGGARDVAGPFLVGGAGINKQANIATFLTHLKAAGFPMAQLGQNGFAALDYAKVQWGALEKKISKKDTKTYDVPVKFLGFVTPEEVAGLGLEARDDAGSAVAQAPAIAAAVVDDTEAREVLTAALKTALAATPNGIAKGQLSKTVGPAIQAHPKKAQMFSLLLKDDFLASIDGVTFDKTTVKLAGAA